MDLSKIVVDMIRSSRYMVVASATLDGIPWVTPLNYAYDDEFRLYWVSGRDAKHTGLIDQNPRVSIVIYSTNEWKNAGEAVYITGQAKRILEMDLHGPGLTIHGLPNLPYLSKAQTLGLSESFKIYRAVPDEFSIRSGGTDSSGNYVIGREEIDLNA